MRSHFVLPVFTLALFAGALTVAGQTPEALVGTWKTNVAKSTYSPGQPTHVEIIVRFDSTDRPLVGAAVPTTRAYKRIDDRTYEFVQKEHGKVTTTFRSVAAPGGKSRTATTTGTNAQGQSVKNVVLYEKQ
jgi:hypothetical protein